MRVHAKYLASTQTRTLIPDKWAYLLVYSCLPNDCKHVSKLRRSVESCGNLLQTVDAG